MKQFIPELAAECRFELCTPFFKSDDVYEKANNVGSCTVPEC